MENTLKFRKFVLFQLVNFLVSAFIWLIFPINVFGIAFIYPVFAIKVIALLWFNEYPTHKSLFDLIFFGFAVADVVVIFAFGSFSVYSLFLLM